MTRTKKFSELRKQLKTDLRNPGCVELDNEINNTPFKKIGTVNKPLLVGVGCISITAFVAGYAVGKGVK